MFDIYFFLFLSYPVPWNFFLFISAGIDTALKMVIKFCFFLAFNKKK